MSTTDPFTVDTHVREHNWDVTLTPADTLPQSWARQLIEAIDPAGFARLTAASAAVRAGTAPSDKATAGLNILATAIANLTAHLTPDEAEQLSEALHEATVHPGECQHFAEPAPCRRLIVTAGRCARHLALAEEKALQAVTA